MLQEDFIAVSETSKEIKNSAELLKTLDINALITGEKGVGKKSLAKFIAPDANIFNAKELQNDIADNVISLSNCSIIVDKIDEITNIDLIINWVENNSIKVIATSQKEELNDKLAEIFSITLEIPPLDKRKDDIKPLANKFSKEASSILGISEKPQKLIINTSENAYSLRKSIFFSYLFESIGENEIMMLMEKYLVENMLENDNIYRDFVYLFEAPLLRASQKRYKSQVQMAKNLGLNRITLRKKLELHKELL